ncbi:MAG: hypothetical protein JW751_21365 [Polyangiaceae bacterium]|nr:hypothetical protein [Polyangiaceae bacterium]
MSLIAFQAFEFTRLTFFCSEAAATKAAACRTTAVADACENPLAIEVCGTDPITDDSGEVGPGIPSSCPELTEEDCVKGRQPHSSMAWPVLCLDPAGEFYDPDFAGDCVARFAHCLGM